MKSSIVGRQPLCDLAEALIDAGIPVDIVNPDINERVVPRTDKYSVCSLIDAYGDSDLVIPLGGTSGLVALEICSAQGGIESLKKLWRHHPVGKTPVVATADGRIYLLMRFAGMPNTTRVTLGPGLTLVANEQHIVVPPKKGLDEAHGWWKHFPTDVEVAPIPEKIAALL